MTNTIATTADTTMSRRHILARLGLFAAAAYTAPVLLQLAEAKASGYSGRPRRRPRRRPRGRRRSYS